MQSTGHERRPPPEREMFRLLEETVRDHAVFALDALGRVCSWTGGAERLFGYAAAEVLGRDGALLFTLEDRAAAAPERELALARQQGRAESERWQVRKDGTRFFGAAVVVPVRDGPEGGFARVVREVTGRREVEEELRRSEARYRDLFENANDIIYTLDLEGRITSLNRRAEQTFGYGREECLGRNAAELVPPEYHEQMREALARKLSGQESPTTYELEILRKDGGRVPVEVSTRLIVRDGRPAGIQGIARDVSDRRRADRALRESEERFRLALESGAITAFEQDAELRYTWVYPQDPDFPEGNIGRTDEELVPGDEGRALTELKREVLRSGRRARREIRVTIPGGVRHYDLIVEPHRDASGAVVGVGGAAIDVTRYKRIEQALRESEERFHKLADNLPHGFIYQILQQADGSRRFTYVSGGVELLCGVTPAEATADPALLYGMIVEEDAERVRAQEEAAVLEGRPFDCQFRVRARGELRWLHCRSAPRPVAGLTGLAVWDGIAIDVTARRQAEEALRASEEWLRLALDAGRIGVWDWDVVRNEVVWSDRVYEFHGLEPGTFGGKLEDFAALIHPDERARVGEAIRHAVEGGRPYGVEFRVVRPDGEVRWISAAGRVLYEAGRPVRMLGATLDVTERRAAEEALREAARRKDEFLAMLAHELRNPLAPIRNAAQVLQVIGPPDPQAQQLRDIIDRQVTHMARLVDDLLDVSRISRGKVLLRKELIDLTPLVRSTAEDHRPLLERTGLTMRVELPDAPLWVEGDPTRLSQVVGNLLHNAQKFTDAGGEVTVRLTAGDDAAEVEVADSGIGMDAEILARLFEPFSQADRSLDRSRGGLGLGLALVKGLAELHGGSVVAASPGPGRGSRFTVRLPLSPPPAGEGGPGPNRGSVGRRLRVLIVEDNRDAAESLRILLGLAGHRVEVAATGQAGLEAAAAFRPEVVLCDIGLPGGLDGYDVARRLRADQELFGVTLIALSGYGQEEDQRRAREAGFDRHLTKPVDPGVLSRILDALAV